MCEAGKHITPTPIISKYDRSRPISVPSMPSCSPGSVAHWLDAEDLETGRLESIELEGPAAGVMPFQAVYPTGHLHGRAGRWLVERLTQQAAG